jgi:hypothetical protein
MAEQGLAQLDGGLCGHLGRVAWFAAGATWGFTMALAAALIAMGGHLLQDRANGDRG